MPAHKSFCICPQLQDDSKEIDLLAIIHVLVWFLNSRNKYKTELEDINKKVQPKNSRA